MLVNKTPIDRNYKTPGPTTLEIGSLRHASFLLDYPKQMAGGTACVPVSNICILFGGRLDFRTVSIPDTIGSCGVVDESPYFFSATGAIR